MQKRNKIKLLILGFGVICAIGISPTYAFNADPETSKINRMNSTALDITMSSATENFIPMRPLVPGDMVSRTIALASIGRTETMYRMFYSFDTGDADLCNDLDLRVVAADSSEKYKGKLKDFTTVSPTVDPSFRFLTGDLASRVYTYEVTVPANLSPLLQSKTCSFKLVTNAWQPIFTNETEGYTDIEMIANTITTGMVLPAAIDAPNRIELFETETLNLEIPTVVPIIDLDLIVLPTPTLSPEPTVIPSPMPFPTPSPSISPTPIEIPVASPTPSPEF